MSATRVTFRRGYSELDGDGENDELKDSADRLLGLIERIISAGKEVRGNSRINQHHLYKALPRIAGILGFDSYVEFITTFYKLVERTRSDLRSLPFKRSSVRDTALEHLHNIEGAFDAEHFSNSAEIVFQSHFTDEALASLDNISDRLQSAGNVEAGIDQLSQALEDAESLAALCSEAGEISLHARKLISSQINHLKSIINHYQAFGETDFWDTYRVLFSAFLEIHESLFRDGEMSQRYKQDLKKMLGRLMVGSSLTANVITIGGPVIGLLT